MIVSGDKAMSIILVAEFLHLPFVARQIGEGYPHSDRKEPFGSLLDDRDSQRQERGDIKTFVTDENCSQCPPCYFSLCAHRSFFIRG